MLIGKKMDSTCKICNETDIGTDIIQRKKYQLEFLFAYYMDDPIEKDHEKVPYTYIS